MIPDLPSFTGPDGSDPSMPTLPPADVPPPDAPAPLPSDVAVPADVPAEPSLPAAFAGLPMPGLGGAPPSHAGFDWKQALMQGLPALVAAVAGHKDPAVTGAMMAGMAQGRQHADALHQQQAEKDAQRKEQSGKFVLEAMGELQKLADSGADPATFAQWAQTFDDVGAQAFGVPKGTITAKVAYPKNAGSKKTQAAAKDAVETILRNNEPSVIAADPWVSFQGQRIKFSSLQALAGLALTDDKGQPILPGERDKAPTTPEESQVADAIAAAEEKKGSKLTRAERAAVRLQAHANWLTLNASKPGTDSDWVTRAREIAIAKNGGKPLSPEDEKAVDAVAIKEFKALGQDPDMQDLKKSTAVLQNAIAALTLSQRQSAGAAVEIKPNTKEYRLAQDLAYGKITMTDFRGLLSARAAGGTNVNALRAAIYDKAGELNPSFNPAQFEMGFKLAANPKTQQQLAALDNALAGAQPLVEASDAAKRSGVTALNRFIVPGGIELGGQKYSNFGIARKAYADELSGALGFGSASDMAKQMGLDMTDPALGSENFASAIQDVVVPFLKRKKQSLLGQMGVYGQPGMNPGAGSPPSSVGMIEAKDKDGNIQHAPAGTPLPAGWTLIKK